MSTGLFDDYVSDVGRMPVGPRAEAKAHAAAEREADDLVFWKGKAQAWAVQLADERLKTARLWAIVRRLRAHRRAD